jgi:hypothetical protein
MAAFDGPVSARRTGRSEYYSRGEGASVRRNLAFI